MKQQADEKGEALNLDDLVYRSWVQDAGKAPLILMITARSKIASMRRVTLNLTVADNANKNVVLPLTSICFDLFGNQKDKQVAMFYKIDPSKEGFGDITCELSDKPGRVTQVGSSTTGTSYTSYTPGGYSSTVYTGGYDDPDV